MFGGNSAAGHGNGPGNGGSRTASRYAQSNFWPFKRQAQPNIRDILGSLGIHLPMQKKKF